MRQPSRNSPARFTLGDYDPSAIPFTLCAPALAENMNLRSSLMLALKEHIAQEGITQTEAAKKFGVTQPRISDLIRGRIDLFAIDTLVNMLATAGIPIELHVGKAA